MGLSHLQGHNWLLRSQRAQLLEETFEVQVAVIWLARHQIDRDWIVVAVKPNKDASIHWMRK